MLEPPRRTAKPSYYPSAYGACFGSEIWTSKLESRRWALRNHSQIREGIQRWQARVVRYRVSHYRAMKSRARDVYRAPYARFSWQDSKYQTGYTQGSSGIRRSKLMKEGLYNYY